MNGTGHFALFDLQPAFELDLERLGARYRELAREVHPDRFASASEAEKRQALERSATLNEAFQTLRQPTLRARHLLALRGREVALESTVQDPEFLMRQMLLREELEELREARDLSGLTTFDRQLKAERRTLDGEFADAYADPARGELAERLVRRMQFLDKLSHEVRQLEEHLDD